MEMDKSRFEQIKLLLKERNEPEYRFKQIMEAIFKQRVDDFEKITTIPKSLRMVLKEKFGEILSLKPIKEQKDEKVLKVLFELKDKERIESVLMDYEGEKKGWQSVCISTQVGCSLNCVFCATGKMGFRRNLTVDEIIDQVLYFHLIHLEGVDIATPSRCESKRWKIHSVSFMGMGEPLLNPATFAAIKILTDKEFFGFGQRVINVSTVGVVPELRKLIKDFPQINIAFSLHTPFDEQRSELMPINKKYPIETVLNVLDEHISKNKRKVFLPYIMMKGVNDTSAHLAGLTKLIRERKKTAYLYHVNLIRYNEISGGCNFQPSDRETVEWFKNELTKRRINATLRQSFGERIKGACGQLRTSI